MLSLKYTETSSIVTINGEKIDLGFIASDPIPPLNVPSYIQVARNTSVLVPDDFVAVRIYQLAKPTPPYLTYKEGKQVLDPASIVAKTLRIEPVQFVPSQIADKLTVSQMDFKAPHLQAALANEINMWMLQQRNGFEVAIINALVQSASHVQETFISSKEKEIATFAQGAHLSRTEINDFDTAEREFLNAIDVFSSIGNINALTEYDKQNRFATGIDATDTLCLCSYKFLSQITKRAGLVSSAEAYEEIFKSMKLNQIYGYDVLPLRTMPKGINFIFITTGRNGAFAFNGAVGGAQVQTVKSPEWSFDVRADLVYNYIAGIVNESFIVASVTPDFPIPKSDAIIPLVSEARQREAQSFAEENINLRTYKVSKNRT